MAARRVTRYALAVVATSAALLLLHSADKHLQLRFRALSMTQNWSGVTKNSATSTLINVDRPAAPKTAPFAPWKSSVACGKYETRLAQFGSRPLMALASFPGSGNTWTRYLMEGATGVFTGSVYGDKDLQSKGFYGEMMNESCGCTLVQKTHGYVVRPPSAARSWSYRRRMVARHGGRAVLLVRNPFEALLSYRNFKAGHVGHMPDKHFAGKGWEEWATQHANLWRQFNIDWLNMTSSLHVIHYENLRRDPVLTLRNFLRFAGLPENEGRLSCIEKYPEGMFKRKTSKEQIFHHKDVFSPAVHVLLDRSIEAVQSWLAVRQQPALPLPRYKYYTPVAVNSTTRSTQP